MLRTCVLVPNVAVEDFSQNVEDTNHHSHRTEEDDPSQGGNALQHRVHPHPCHVVHPARPEPEKVKVTMHLEPFIVLCVRRINVPQDVSYAEAAHCCQSPRPAGIPMVGGPHLDDDEGENGGVLRDTGDKTKTI